MNESGNECELWQLSAEQLTSLLEQRERQRAADWERSEQLGRELLGVVEAAAA
jgi:hypothetical protein